MLLDHNGSERHQSTSGAGQSLRRIGAIALRCALGATAIVVAILSNHPGLGPAWRQITHNVAFFVALLAISRRRRIDLIVNVMVIACFRPSPMGTWLAVVAYAPFFAATMTSRSRGRWMATGMLCFAGQAFCLTNWATESLEHPLLADVALATYAALIGLCVAGLIRLAWKQAPWLRAAAIILAIPAEEWVRAEARWLPLPYNLTAHMVADNRWLAQWVELLGIPGLSALLCATSYLAAAPLRKLFQSWDAPSLASSGSRRALADWAPSLRSTTLFATVIMILAVLGAARASSADAHLSARRLRVALAQEYFPKSEDDDNNPPKRGDILDQRISHALAGQKCDLLLLPENAVHLSPIVEPVDDRFNMTPQRLTTTLANVPNPPTTVAGVQISEANGAYRNTVSVIVAGTSSLYCSRDKLWPAPVGEHAPFAGIPLLEKFGQYMSETDGQMVGSDPRAEIILPAGNRLAVAICYEHVFPEVWRDRKLADTRQVDAQMAFANMRWFGYSPIERQQSRAARLLLAMQERKPFVYVASGGSEWIDGGGALRGQIDPTDAAAVWSIQLYDTETDHLAGPLAAARRVFVTILRWGAFALVFIVLVCYAMIKVGKLGDHSE